MPTKSEQILALYDGVRSCKEIAAMVGTTDSYVRTVARQRRGHMSDADRRWGESALGRATMRRCRKDHYQRLRSDPVAWGRELERFRLRYERKHAASYATEAAKRRDYYIANRERRLAYARQYYKRRREQQSIDA